MLRRTQNECGRHDPALKLDETHVMIPHSEYSALLRDNRSLARQLDAYTGSPMEQLRHQRQVASLNKRIAYLENHHA